MAGVHLPIPGKEYKQAEIRRIIGVIEQRLSVIEQPVQIGYTTLNVVTTRAFDADATTLAEVADVLSTLIEDLKARGLLA